MAYKNKHNAIIIVATHKPYRMPKDSLYLPVHVGAAGKESMGFTRDDSGDNISELNPEFCELTGLYWAWKNLDADYLGLVHYRRYFCGKRSGGSFLKRHIFSIDPFSRVLTSKEIDYLLNRYKVILPVKRRYFIETLYSHYIHTHQVDEFNITINIIRENYPEYVGSYNKVMARTWGYMFNMAVLPKDMMNEYCEWLFDILFKLREKIDSSRRSDFEKRYPGRVAELLFNVWIKHKLDSGELAISDIAELPFIYMERINWLTKGASFLAAKFFGVKQTKSF